MSVNGAMILAPVDVPNPLARWWPTVSADVRVAALFSNWCC